MPEPRSIQVALIGGGCAAMATAFELTRPQHQGKYQVTLYQLGWRLGGKGASGRGVAGRIEEHGLHLWLGFYENAFRLMRECYAELARDPATCPISEWTEAFRPDPWVGVADRTPRGEWLRWLARFPPRNGLPGDPLDEDHPFTLESYLLQGVALLQLLVRSAQGGASGWEWREPTASGKPKGGSLGEITERIRRLLGYGQLASHAALLEALTLLEMVMPMLPGPAAAPALRLIEALADSTRLHLERLLRHNHELRRVWHLIDLVLAVFRGVVRFGLLTDPRGLDAIDEYDCRQWLILNGASPEAAECGFVRGLYDLALAYQEGDVEHPRIAAGAGLRGMLRMFFTYRGALFWKMQAGMGDIVFAPFYEVLKRRGVRFEFFHRLENVRLEDAPQVGGRPHVAALEMSVQAEVRGGGEYQPLVDVEGLPCWPSVPDFSQLTEGDRWAQEGRDFESHWDRREVRKRILKVGEDFDFVVLAVGFGAIPHVCKEFIARDSRWRKMVERVETVATQAFQVWMNEDMEALGWDHPPSNISGYVHPFDTWADMSHLARVENWPRPPRSIAYFCSVLRTTAEAAGQRPEDVDPQLEAARVRDHVVSFLNRDICTLWPAAVEEEGGFRWQLLVDPHHAESSPAAPADCRRFDSQFWTANVNPTDRYVLSLPGTLRCRISPLDPTYDNLTVAGDWTANGHNEACVESAIMSGRLAAHALSGLPRLEDIVGYDHP